MIALLQRGHIFLICMISAPISSARWLAGRDTMRVYETLFLKGGLGVFNPDTIIAHYLGDFVQGFSKLSDNSIGSSDVAPQCPITQIVSR